MHSIFQRFEHISSLSAASGIKNALFVFILLCQKKTRKTLKIILFVTTPVLIQKTKVHDIQTIIVRQSNKCTNLLFVLRQTRFHWLVVLAASMIGLRFRTVFCRWPRKQLHSYKRSRLAAHIVSLAQSQLSIEDIEVSAHDE